MRFSSRTWMLISLLLMAAAVWFWRRGDEAVARRNAMREAVSEIPAPGTGSSPANPPASTLPTVSPAPAAGSTVSTNPGRIVDEQFPHRLRNTREPLDVLGRKETALLLENALIDTAIPARPGIPEHLRAGADPGSYIVQARNGIDAAFYDLIAREGAEWVSYIPNNALLVRATAPEAGRLAAAAGVQAVFPYEPYFKVSQDLLPTAVNQELLDPDQALNVVVFAGEREAALASLNTLGAQVLAEDRTPFGPMLTIQPPLDGLVAIAALNEVQRIEAAFGRTLLNDLTRVRMEVAAGALDPVNHLGLTGAEIIVNVNDTGIDASHPDLAGRVSSTDTNSFTLLDLNGHGTHVAGTIAGSGASSSTVVGVTGSLSNANFRGMAPGADLFVLPIDLQTGPLVSDAFLQERAASENYVTRGRTNAMVSNNSWAYIGAFGYNTTAASFDAAVRDALPDMTGSQPMIYVFAAGNSGDGTTNGAGGLSGSVSSPATAKNVITVGAIENLRGITNEVYAGYTDSDNEVASFSSRGNVGVGIEGAFGRFKPDVVAPGTFLVSTRSTHSSDSPGFDLGPLYRYSSGTSMAAPAVSGVLALMQDYFENRFLGGYSPALFKAFLINGGRSINSVYDLRARKVLNLQGWGLVNLAHMLPGICEDLAATNAWPFRFVDQNPAESLATGETHTWNLTLSANALLQPLRVTLVWTDPPGNPGAAIKLVNNLDLLVTNLTTGDVYVGNNILAGTDFTVPGVTNLTVEADIVNNVENVFVEPPGGTNFSISVVGRRVNVNAVTANDTGIVQDYALVISSGDGTVTNTIASLSRETPPDFRPPLAFLTNGVVLLNQQVGANFQLNLSTNGSPEQWNFYVFTNVFTTNNFPGMTNGSNVAFITFLPPDLARPRQRDADIDLYVSRDARLTNLEPSVVAAADKSLTRGGTESVVYTNSPIGPDVVYYIGVKSEDQQSAEFGIVALSTTLPFDEALPDGSRLLRGFPPNVPVEDGSPELPGAGLMFAIGVEPVAVSGIVVSNQITHDSIGDLLGNLSHEDQFVVLNNHNRFGGGLGSFYDLLYDDSNSGAFLASRHTDGPGTLNDFLGLMSQGVWLLTMTDNSPGFSGVVNGLGIVIRPLVFFAEGVAIPGSVLANQWTYYVLDLPPDASRLTVTLSQMIAPLNLYIRRGAFPTTTEYDKAALIDPPGGSLSIGLGDVPPINPGRYFIGVFNPNAVTVNYYIAATLERNLPNLAAQTYVSTAGPAIGDDAVTRYSLLVTNNRPVTDFEVALRIDHERASDLVLHLVSPGGRRILLTENRGGVNTAGYGETLVNTNLAPRTSTGGPQEDRNVINVGMNFGTLELDYEFYVLSDTLRVYYDEVLIFDTGEASGRGTASINFGPGASTDLTIVVNEGGNQRSTTAWTYTAQVLTEQYRMTVFTERTNRTITPIKFAAPPFVDASGVTTNLEYFNGFDADLPTEYCAITNFNGWTVLSNSVSVVNDPFASHSVSNYLSLGDGTLSIELPTLSGGQYRFTHVYRDGPPDPSLVGWWRGEGNGQDAVTNRNVQLRNNVSFTNGMVQQAFFFDGVNDQVYANPFPSFNIQGNLTLDAWILPADLTKPYPVVEFTANTGRPGSHLWINASPAYSPGTLFVDFRDATSPNNSGVYVLVSPTNLVRAGQWQHVAATYDQASGIARLYHNGSVVAATNFGAFTPRTALGLSIGRRNPGSGEPNVGASFFGAIDEVDLFNRALAPSEIKAIYLAGSGGKCGAQADRQFPVPVSSWPGDGYPNDFTDGNPGILLGAVSYAPGQVGEAFSFDGLGEVRINDAANLNHPTNLTLDAWVYPTFVDGEMDAILFKEVDGGAAQYGMAIKGPLNTSCPGATLQPGRFAFLLNGVAGLPVDEFCSWVDGGGVVPTNQWTHLAVTFDGSTARAYINGVATRTLTNLSGAINGSAGTLRIGSRSPSVLATLPQEGFNGRIDEVDVFDRALDTCDIQLIHRMGSAGKYSLRARPGVCPADAAIILDDRLTNALQGTFQWQTNTMNFTASRNGTPFTLVGREPGVWFDSFTLSQLVGASTYFLPEETLRPLFGESAVGLWTLEVWDNRAGAYLDLPAVSSWELRFNFANTNPPALLLTNCVPFTNVVSLYVGDCEPQVQTVAGEEIRYFMVDVPRRATRATNLLESAGDLVLLFNPDGLPGLGSAGDVFVDNFAAGGEFLLLNTNTPPLLRPGQRYYLGVANFNPNETNTFVLSAAFDQIDGSLINVIELTNAIPYTTNAPVTNALQYYQFTVSTNATSVQFDLTPTSGNVDLVVRRARPVLDPLPRPNPGFYDYISQNPGLTPDQVLVTPSSQPVTLEPGVWYLGVYNPGAAPSDYAIVATETLGAPTLNIVTLVNNVPLDFILGAAAQFTNFFRFTVPQPVQEVQFELYDLSGRADLLLDAGFLPSSNSFLGFAPADVGNPAFIRIATNLFFPDVTGNWYLAVDNLSGQDLQFTIKAVALGGATNGIIIDPSITLSNNMICLEWDSIPGAEYHIESNADLLNPVWVVASPTITATGATTSYCLSITGIQQYFRVVAGAAPPAPGGATFTSIAFTGTAFVLNWTASPGQRFIVEYANSLPPVWTAFPGQVTSATASFTFTDDGSQSGGLNQTRYYRLILVP